MPFRNYIATFAALALALAGFVAVQVASAATPGTTPRTGGGTTRPDTAIAIPPDTTAPAVMVLSPNTPQIWAMGATKKISWKAIDDRRVDSVDLGFSPDSGTTWLPIAFGLANVGSHSWKVPNHFTTRALIRVTARDEAGNEARDESNATFEVRDRLAPTMAVTTPNGGQIWGTGTPHKVTWKATDNIGVVRVDLSYSANAGATWTTVASGLANTGFIMWNVPNNVVTTTGLFKAAAKDSAGNASSDVSNAFFEIRDLTLPAMTVTTPNGGQVWDAGSQRKITWKATDNIRVTGVDLAYSPDSGTTWIPIATDLPNTGSWLWTLPGRPSRAALFRATARDSMGNSRSDLGNAPFVIRDVTRPAVRLTSPNGGETLFAGEDHTITWSSSDNDRVASVDLDYSMDGGLLWTTIAASIPDAGSHRWTAPLAPSALARVRVVVRDAAGNTAQDASDASFEVRVRPSLPPRQVTRVLSLSADSASGIGPHPVPGADPVWVDLVGSRDGILGGFDGSLASGWAGNGTSGNPHRLEFAGEEQGWNNRVAIPAGSVPELQTVGALTAAVWFRTGYGGASSRYDYVLEWVQEPTPDLDPEYEGRGMSIIVQGGKIQVYANPWIDVCPAEPGRWYHVAVAKDTNDLRVWVNGALRHSGTKSHRGIQQSEIALGASIFRRFEGREGDTAFDDYFTGAIGRFDLWEGTLTDADVVAAFRADSARYLAPGPARDSAVVVLDAALATGSGPYASPGAASPWVDLAGVRSDFGLFGFDGTASSGWIGDGSAWAPYALKLDGIDDAVAVDAATIPELLAEAGHTLQLDFRTGADVSHESWHYLVEWLEAFGGSAGMSVAIWEGRLRLYAGALVWTDLAAVAPNTNYRLVIAKGPGDVRAYLDGVSVHAGTEPNLGVPSSGIVLGSSTWRGPSTFGDHFEGSLSGLKLWARTLSDAEITGSIVRSAAPVLESEVHAAAPRVLGLAGARPNPVRGAMHVHFSLPNAAAASLEVVDVAGRVVSAHDVGVMGPGQHRVSLGAGRGIAAGVYWIRLRQGGVALVRKAIVLD